MHKPRITDIKDIYSETKTIKTIYIKDHKINANIIPGQFIMVWIPGLDEIPMGISHILEDDYISFTVEEIGEATSKLCRMRVGDKIGVRGPYGNCFSELKEKNIIIGGGSGMAPLIPLIDLSVKIKKSVKVILGAKNGNKLPFLKYLEKNMPNYEKDVIVTTEDGSFGEKGIVTDVLINLIKTYKFEKMYACGPELMIRAVYDLALKSKIDLEVSLERYFKCGIGICGSCSIGPYRVCMEGPVFNITKLKNIDNIFGHYTRDASGAKINLKK